MAKYKIEFSGFAYVDAETEEEARDKWSDEDITYSEMEMDEVYEVDSFDVDI